LNLTSLLIIKSNLAIPSHRWRKDNKFILYISQSKNLYPVKIYFVPPNFKTWLRACTKPPLPIDWHWLTLLALQGYNLSSKLITQTHQLHYLVSRMPFSDTLGSLLRIKR